MGKKYLLDIIASTTINNAFTSSDMQFRASSIETMFQDVLDFKIEYEMGETISVLVDLYRDAGFDVTTIFPDVETNLTNNQTFLYTYYDKNRLISDLKKAEFNFAREYNGLFEDKGVLTAMLLPRLIFLNDSNGELRDGKRKYHWVSTYSHSFQVALLAYQLTGEKEVFISAILHDVVEDFEPLQSRYKEIKSYFRNRINLALSKEISNEKVEEEIKLFEEGKLVIEGKENLVKEYWEIRADTVKKVAEAVYGNADSKEKTNLIKDLDKFSKKPWQGLGIFYERSVDGIVTNGKTVQEVLDDKELSEIVGRELIVKLIDRLHNISTDFDIKDQPNKLKDRIESLYEASVVLNKVDDYLTQAAGRYIGLSNNDYAKFTDYLSRKNNLKKKEAKEFKDILAKFRSIDLTEISREFKYYNILYSLSAQLAVAFQKDIGNMVNVTTKGTFFEALFSAEGGDYLSKASTMKSYLKSKVSDINREIGNYFAVGGYFQRTDSAKEWDRRKEKYELDGFLDRIGLMAATKDFDRYESLMTKKGAYNFIRDIMALEGIALMHLGKEKTKEGRIRSDYSNKFIYLTNGNVI